MAEKEIKKGDITPAELAALCAKIADDRKASDIKQLQVTELSVIADYFVLCTGNSEPHIRAIAERIGRDVRDQVAVRPRAVEGTPASKWILMDFGAVVVHILTPETRELYQLESLWGDAPEVQAIETIEKITAEQEKA